MFATIWDDINQNKDVISEINYNPLNLSNVLYEIIDNKEKFRQVLKKNQVRGLFQDLDEIRKHRNIIEKDDNLNKLISCLFIENPNISSIDRIFLNAYHRKLLRAKLENDFLDKELLENLIITDDPIIDNFIVKTLKLLRVITRYLGITSTFTEASFHINKLYMPKFWNELSEKFVPLFGEDLIKPMTNSEVREIYNVKTLIILENLKKLIISEVLLFLNVVFNKWSGSNLVLESDDTIKVVPATFVTRMLPLLRQ